MSQRISQSPNHSISQSLNSSSRGSLFWRLWRRALSVKRPQALLAMGSLLVGATVASMLLNLYGDVQRKMTQEFRAYGANVVLAPASGNSGEGAEPITAAGPAGPTGLMSEEALAHLDTLRGRLRGLAAVPMLYVVVRLQRVPPDPRLPEFQNVVAVGTEFDGLQRLNPGWRVEGSRQALDPGTCAIGSRIAAQLRVGVGDFVQIETLPVAAGGVYPPGRGGWRPPLQRLACHIASVVTTGASEDDQVFVSLSQLQQMAGTEGRISLAQLSIPGETAQVERAILELSQAFPGLEVRPIRQIVYSEGKVLGAIRWLLLSLTVLILVIIVLCVTATMTAIVLERRKDIAVMKALGASNRLLMELFLSEGAGLGLAGGLAGYVLGTLVASDLARRLFAVSLNLVWWTLPLVCAATSLLAVLATLFPVRMVREVQPAVVLKGE
jgi:putative ABC transport system permease protein